MEGEKYMFFRTGETLNKKPDLVVDLKWTKIKDIQKWTPEQRRLAANWLKNVERAFNRYKNEILTA